MTVFIGETGAGKSIFIEALSLLAGARFSTDVIGTYGDFVQIEGLFEFDKNSRARQLLLENEYLDDQSWLFSRTLTKAGRSIYRINGQVTTLQTVREVLAEEIDIHSQFDSQQLLQTTHQLSLLDHFGSHQDLRSQVAQRYQELAKIRKEYKAFLHQQLSETQLEFLRFQFDELNQFKPSVEEEQQLTQQVKSLTEIYNAQKSLVTASQQLETLDIGLLYNAIGQLESLKSESNEIMSIIGVLKDSYFSLETAVIQLNQLLKQDIEEDNLDQLQERLYEYSRMKRKYQVDTQGLCDLQTTIHQQLSQLDDRQFTINEFEKKQKQAQDHYNDVASKLSQKRQQTAKRLSEALVPHLQDLKLEKAQFEVRFEKVESDTGIDAIEFFVRMNPGQKFASLAKTASGGELSRLMLALKTVFNESHAISTLIFDEIDSGVSGEVALQMGLKMRQLAAHSQIIVVSHLPAVAATSDHLYLISKLSDDQQTEVKIDHLNTDEKIEQIALMAFASTQPTALKAASELIDDVVRGRHG